MSRKKTESEKDDGRDCAIFLRGVLARPLLTCFGDHGFGKGRLGFKWRGIQMGHVKGNKTRKTKGLAKGIGAVSLPQGQG